MKEQDIEVALEVIKEKQKLHDERLADLDECCGKLKGTINAEVMVINERIVKIESSMDNNCKDVEIQIKGLEEQNKSQYLELSSLNDEKKELVDKIDRLDAKLDKKISKIAGYYMTFTLGILVSMAIGLIALIR